ncbi:MAG: hypothetical protein QOI10_3277 [Solirubrobacterales bacterium]|jgi:hypothetical protein|nr:hypothetical protein [Solirubrobacterales bacterium]
MHARVVRFTDVSPERIAELVSRIEEGDGPPPGVESTGMKLLYDADQSTAVFVGFFETEQNLRDADAVFEQMDSGETPGTRASVDRCEVKLEMDA